MSIYDTLNKPQKEAVLCTEGPLLILAGAGSGKTRVLTHRIAYLIEELGVNPWNILAITFTNKAAGEMRQRVDNLVGFGSESIWVSTFHSMCVRILRRYIDRLGYDNRFTIYDTDDQKTLMKAVCKKVDIDTKQFKERMLLSVISSAKNEMVLPEEFELNAGGDFARLKIAKVYREYERQLKANNALDFDDLLVRTVQLLQTQPDVRESYQERFRYIMVDEYQDTNTVQFKLVSLLAGKYRNLCVVGDDDQSIYKFRGANIRNILDFEKEYPDAKVIRLEQNYRSTENILNAANSVIKNNKGRKDKTLWTDNGEGDKVVFRQFDTGYDEAEFIAEDIQREVRDGAAYNDNRALPDERPVPSLRGEIHRHEHPLQDRGRHQLLCTQGDQGSAGLPENRGQRAGRPGCAPDHQRAEAGHRPDYQPSTGSRRRRMSGASASTKRSWRRK